MRLRIVGCSIVIVALGFSGTGWSETSQEKGHAIAKEAKRRDLGWKDSEVTLKMVLKNSQRESSCVRERPCLQCPWDDRRSSDFCRPILRLQFHRSMSEALDYSILVGYSLRPF